MDLVPSTTMVVVFNTSLEVTDIALEEAHTVSSMEEAHMIFTTTMDYRIDQTMEFLFLVKA